MNKQNEKLPPALVRTFRVNARKRLAVLGQSMSARCAEAFPDQTLPSGQNKRAKYLNDATHRRRSPGLVVVGEVAEALDCEPWQLLHPDWNGEKDWRPPFYAPVAGPSLPLLQLR